MKHVPRVSPYALDPIDPGLVEIGLIQLSQSVKATNVTNTRTHITDRLQVIKKWHPVCNPGMKRLFALKAKNGLGRFASSALPHTSRDVNEARWPHTCCRPCAFEEKKSKKTKTAIIHPAQNTPRYPQQAGDRDHLETARDETHPTRYPIHARFHRSRVCGNRPRTALAIVYGKNGLGRFVPPACFFTANSSEKREKKDNPPPPPAIFTATPTGHPTPSKLRGRVGKSLRPARS